MGSCACVAPIPAALMRSYWPSPAKSVDFVPRAVGDAWRRHLLTWLITSFHAYRCVNGCFHCRFRCAILLAAHPHLLTPVLQVIHRAISTFLVKQAELNRSEAKTGAITLIQRFGSAANLNIHLHCLVLDGVYRLQNGIPEFHSVRPPTAEQLQVLLGQIIKRFMKALTRHGALIEEEDMTYLAEMETDLALAPLQSAACTYRIALGPRAGQKVLTLRSIPAQEIQPQPDKKYCANAHGFSLHAGVRCAMNQRKALEHLCRYITRPAIANERLALNSAGQVVLTLKMPYQDGTTHIVMSPLEFMQRLATLVPRPRLNLIRFASFRFAKYLLTPFHGVLAPNAKLRSKIIPGEQKSKSSDADDESQISSPKRIGWARLLKRVFDIDMEYCPNCGGNMKIIAAILESSVITKILNHLGLSARAPSKAPARDLGFIESV